VSLIVDGEGVLIECNYERIFEGGGTKGKLVGKIHSQDSFLFFLDVNSKSAEEEDSVSTL